LSLLLFNRLRGALDGR